MKKIKGFINLAVLAAPAIGFFVCCAAVTCMQAGEPFAGKLIGGLIVMAILPAVAFFGGLANV
ncbi:MAG: hypothetical protein IKU08_09100 [Clostridia bacterium]|nr:hypothetical protein [Clostridia bacterium]